MGLAGGIASSVAARANQGRANREVIGQQGLISQNNAENNDMFNWQYWQDVTQRSEVQDILRRQQEYNASLAKRNKANESIMGSSKEVTLQNNANIAKSNADMIAGIAQNASTLKDSYLNSFRSYKDRYLDRMLGMSDKRANIQANIANQWSTAGNNMFSTGANMLGNIFTT